MLQAPWLLAAALAGMGFALATPPTDVTVLAWVALVALAYVLDAESAAKRAWLSESARGLAFGFGVSLVGLRFVPRVIARFTPLPFAAGVVALVLLAAAQGLPWAAAGIARRALARARVPSSLAFAIAVYASTFVPMIFPWTPACGVAKWPALIQLADTIGERGVSGLLALSAGLLAQATRELEARGSQAASVRSLRAPILHALLAFAIPGAMALHGAARMHAIDARRAASPAIRVGLVQPAIEATTRWDPAAAPAILAKLVELTRVAEARGARVTVWPESAYPYVLARGETRLPAGDQSPFQRGVRGPLVVGAITIDANRERYNAVLAALADGSLPSEYDKLHLLWFGEEVPLAGSLPWLRRTFARGLGMVPGDRPVRVDAGRVKAGVLVCFEDILPGAGREAASVSPNLLVNVSNDAWFAGSSESDLHLRLAILRAVEARRDLVRAVNLGTPSFVDAAGRVRASSDDPAAGTLVVTATLLEGAPTFYAAWGDWPLLTLSLALAGLLLARTKRNERRITK